MKNIIVIMADQLRSDFLKKGYTPNIDKLIDEGVSFNNAYCASPLCVPARGSFFTGTYPAKNGCLINPWRKRDAEYGLVKEGFDNLYETLERDYDVWHTGKQHFLTYDHISEKETTKVHWTNTEKDYKETLEKRNITPPGGKDFTSFVPEMQCGKHTYLKRYSVPHTGCYEGGLDNFFDKFFFDGAISAIENRDKSKPFALSGMFLAPHPPLHIPKEWYEKYDEVEISENVGIWYENQSPLQIYNLTGAVGVRYNKEQYKEAWRTYAGLVNLFDYLIGELILKLKQEGIYDDTLIVFTSDHGEMLGSHSLFQKMCMYQESVKTPLVFKFPKDSGIKSGIVDDLVSAIDVFPTILSYLGYEIPKCVDGINLMPIIKGEKLEREEIFIQFDGNGALGNFQRCIIKNNFKLIVDIFKDETFLELYDIKNDKFEKENLVYNSQYENIVREMFKSLEQHFKSNKDILELSNINEILDNMKNYKEI